MKVFAIALLACALAVAAQAAHIPSETQTTAVEKVESSLLTSDTTTLVLRGVAVLISIPFLILGLFIGQGIPIFMIPGAIMDIIAFKVGKVGLIIEIIVELILLSPAFLA